MDGLIYDSIVNKVYHYKFILEIKSKFQIVKLKGEKWQLKLNQIMNDYNIIMYNKVRGRCRYKFLYFIYNNKVLGHNPRTNKI
jgi:hypothetical protein